MIKNYYFNMSLLLLLFVTSCKKEETANDAIANQKAVPSVYEILNGTNIPREQRQMQQSRNATVAPNQNTTTITPQPPIAVAKGMNPPHGQPGHRCDIKVGEPLNSPPGKTPTQGITQVPKNNNQSFTVTPATTAASGNSNTASQNSGVPALLSTPTTAPGMNPPHGQEGHRCDIAVGAPLSKS